MGELEDALGSERRRRDEAAAWAASPVPSTAPTLRTPQGDQVAVFGGFCARVREWDDVWIGRGPDGTERWVHSDMTIQRWRPWPMRMVLGGADRAALRRRCLAAGLRPDTAVHVVRKRGREEIDAINMWVFRDARHCGQLGPMCNLTDELARWLVARGWA